MPGVRLFTSGDVNAADAVSELVIEQSVPSGVPSASPSTTGEVVFGAVDVETLASITLALPVCCTVKEKNANPPGSSVPSKSDVWGPRTTVGSVGVAGLLLPPQAAPTSRID